MKAKVAVQKWGGVILSLLFTCFLIPQTLNADVTNCLSGTHLPTEGNWSVKYTSPTNSLSWLGSNHKVCYVHNPSSGTNIEEVNLTGDVLVTDRIFVGSSTANGVNPAGNAKLIIRNNAGRPVTITQYIWGSRTSGKDENGVTRTQWIDNNCLFTVWGRAELIIEGTEENPIIIDGGSTQTAISDWEANSSASSNTGAPFNKIIWGLIESNGTLTLRNVIIRNVVFSNMYAASKDANGNFYCDCSCIKLNSGYSSTYPYVLGNTILDNVTFEGVESPAGGGCILTCYSDLNANPSNTKSSTKITMTNCTVKNTKQYGTINDTSPYVQGLMRFNNNCCADVEMSNCTFENNTATCACAGIYWSSNCTDSQGQRPRLTINNGTYKNNTSIRGSAIYVDYGDVTMTGNATFEGNEATSQEAGAVFLYQTKDIKVENAVFRNNKAPQSNGGAIRLYDQCNLTISNSAVFDGNYAKNGGAMYVYHSTATIGKATFSNNYATQSGGALYSHLANTTIQAEALFEGNHADGDNYSSNSTMYTGGGAVYSYEYDVLNITNATFRNNYALPNDAGSGRGGAIMVFNGGNKSGGDCLNIDGALFEGNKSKVGGGAVFFMNNVTDSSNGDFQYATIKNATFRDNVSAVGGAIGTDGKYANDTRDIFITLENNIIENNWACLGGGLAIQEAKVTYNGGLIRNNTANHRRKKDLVANSTDETIDTSDGVESNTGHTLQGLWGSDRKVGYGGGVAVTERGILSFDNSKGSFGIYNNTALLGGDDIIGDGSDGFTTSVQLPDLWSDGTANLDGMNLPAELKRGIRWMEDYHKDDNVYLLDGYTVRGSGYTPGDISERYRTLMLERSKELVKKTIGAGTYNKYIAVALGYPFIYVTIEKTGLKKGDTSIFNIYSNKDATGTPYMSIAITNSDGDENSTLSKIVALTPGDWTVKETNWSYTYGTTDGVTQIYHELKTDEVANGTNYVYSFKNKAKDNLPPHAESNVQNELTKSN